MTIAHVSLHDSNHSSTGCLFLVLCAIGIIFASLQLFFVDGFWLRCGMFLTIFVGCIIGGGIGLRIGTAAGLFVSPESILTKASFWGLLRIKLFWRWGPSLLGMLFGAVLGMHLLLMLFWGMPITSLGRGRLSFVKAEKQPSLAERWENSKKNVAFLDMIEKADTQTRNNYLLMCAIDAGSVKMVEKLMMEDVDVNTPRTVLQENGLPYPNCDPLSPLWTAITTMLSDKEIVALLVHHGADVNERWEKMKGPTPLLYCLRNNKLELAEILIQKGADLTAVDIEGKTPLHHAVNKKMVHEMIIMLEKGADLSAKDKYNNTPWDYAGENEKQLILKWQKKQKEVKSCLKTKRIKTR